MSRTKKIRTLFALMLAAGIPAAAFSAPAAPALNSPVESARNIALNPTLSWDASSTATAYRLQVSITPDFTDVVCDQAGIAGTSQKIGNILSSSLIAFGAPDNSYGDTRGKSNPAGSDQRLQFYRKPGGGYLHWEYAFGELNDFGRIWEGTLSDPAGGGAVGNYGWSWNGITGHQCAWVMSSYQVNPASPDTVLGIVHNETDGQEDGPYPWRLGLAVSKNMGESWTYCGDILKPAGCTTQGSNDYNVAGGVAIKKDGYFYFYFNETPAPNLHPNDSTYPAVARAPITEVLDAARRNTVSTWKKYAGGAWDTDAFTGRGDRIFTLSYGPQSLPDLHESATYVKPTGTYLMGVNAQDAHKLIMLASTDGLTWDNEYVLQNARGSVGMCPYGSFVGDSASGASRDQWEQGTDFYFYWNEKVNDYVSDNYFWRSRITVTPRVYYWRVNATDGNGTGAWSATRSFTTTARIEGGIPPTRSFTPVRGASKLSSVSLTARLTGHDPLVVTMSLTAGGNSTRMSTSIYNLQGRLILRTVESVVAPGAFTAEFSTSAMSPGPYVVRVQTAEVEASVPVVVAR